MCASSAELAAAVAEQASALGRKYRLLGHDSESEAMQVLQCDAGWQIDTATIRDDQPKSPLGAL